MKKFNTVDEYILSNEQWQDCLLMLREILLAAPLEETIKWNGPVYTFKGKNVAGMAGFKAYAGLWFYQGALLNDKAGKLINASEGETRALRQWRFNTIEEIEADAKLILDYTLEAIENVKAGREIKPKKNKPLVIPALLEEQFRKITGLRESFEGLTLTQKREYVAYISKAKRAETKQKRLEKSIPLIRQGLGVMDKYR